jgi:DNA-binding SARP family transcriptional activator
MTPRTSTTDPDAMTARPVKKPAPRSPAVYVSTNARPRRGAPAGNPPSSACSPAAPRPSPPLTTCIPPHDTVRLLCAAVLAVHDGAATADAILDDLLPDAPSRKAPGRLYTYVSDLRGALRRTGSPGTYLTHPGHRYVLNPDTVEVDLWRLRAALRDAARTADPQTRVASLRCAVTTYRGPLAADADYDWIEPYREAVRQQALDAYLALAEALAGSPAEQLTVLNTAIRHNPYTEALYQQAMRAHAALGHADAISNLRHALTKALTEIDAAPSDDTLALADQLITQAQQPGRSTVPAAAPSDGAAA